MANITVDTDVVAPKKIRVRLVREDHLATSNTFRICFELALALSSALGGAALSLEEVPDMHKVFLLTSVLASSFFLYMSHKEYKRAKSDTANDDE